MLKYTANQKNRRTNPLDFDLSLIAKAANALLGKKRTDGFLKESNPKQILVLLGEINAEALEVTKDPSRALPADAPKNTTLEHREALALEVLQSNQLHLSGSQEMQLPYRLRGSNQLRAITQNLVHVSKSGDDMSANITVSLASLKPVVSRTENTGATKIELEATAENAEFYKTLVGAKSNLQFQDELNERPETKRAWLGNIARRCIETAQAKGNLPQDELDAVDQQFSGQKVPLAKGGVITGVKVTPGKANGPSKVEFEIKFPELEQKILEWQAADEKTRGDHPGKGFISDGILTLHAANNHGCNGRDFVNVAPNLAKALTENAVNAAKKWLGKDGGRELLPEFTRDYATVALTMRNRMRPASRLEPYQSQIKRAEDILPATGSPEETYALETIEDIQTNGATGPNCVGEEWKTALREQELAVWEEDDSIRYSQAISQHFNVENALDKAKTIHANFLGIDPLDGGSKKIEIQAPYLTDELDEEFEMEQERHDQNVFDSKKGDEERLQKSDWIERQREITVTLDTTGPVLRRLTRYATSKRQQELPEKLANPQKNRAEAFDQEIRMPSIQTPRWSKERIDLESFLTEEGLEDLKELRNSNNYADRRLLETCQQTIDNWQNGIQKLDPNAKNPMEGMLLAWAESVADGKDSAKCSLDELVTILKNPAARNAGKVLYGEERNPRHLGLPIRSNPLPLQLLCGEKLPAPELEHGKKVDPSVQVIRLTEKAETLWDMSMRLRCASQVQEDALPDRDETRVQQLVEVIASNDDDLLIAHAAAMEATHKPETLGEYLQKINLPHGVLSIPLELRDLADVVNFGKGAPKADIRGSLTDHSRIFRTPETDIFGGEETYIDPLLDEIKKQGVQISLTVEEEKEVAGATLVAVANFREAMQKSSKAFHAIELPTGKTAEVSLMLSAAEIQGDEEGFFPEAIEILGKEIPRSKTDVEDIATALLIHSPGELTVRAGNDTFLLKKGSGQSWTCKNNDGLVIADKVNRVERLINGAETPDEHEAQSLDAARANAYKARMLANLDKIQPAVESLPPLLLERAAVKEIVRPLNQLTEQLETARGAFKTGIRLIESWEDDADFEPTSEKNIKHAVDNFVKKILGETQLDSEEQSAESRHDYLAQQLITDEDKQKLVEAMMIGGKKALGFELKTVLEKNMKFIEETSTEMLPSLITSMTDKIDDILAQTKDIEKVRGINNSPLGTYLRDTAKYRILEQKIRKEAEKARNTKPTEETPEPASKELLVGVGAQTHVGVWADAESNTVMTNKAWLTGWLRTQQGKENLAKRINTISWMREMARPWKRGDAEAPGFHPKLAIAFLAFTNKANMAESGNKANNGKNRNQEKMEFNDTCISEAVAGGNISEADMKELRRGLLRFEATLKHFGLDPAKTKLRTLLLAAESVNQYCAAPFPVQNPWDTEWGKPLTRVKAKQPEAKDFNVQLTDSTPSLAPVKVPSPFRAKEHEDLEHTSQKVKSINRAANSLFRTM